MCYFSIICKAEMFESRSLNVWNSFSSMFFSLSINETLRFIDVIKNLLDYKCETQLNVLLSKTHSTKE